MRETTNETKQETAKIEKDIGNAQKDMGVVKADVATVKSGVAFMKKQMEKIDDFNSNLPVMMRSFANVSGKLNPQAEMLDELLQQNHDPGKNSEEFMKKNSQSCPLSQLYYYNSL